MKLNSFGMNSHPKRYENTLIEGMQIHSKGMKWCRRYEKIPMIPRYETDAQGMKDSTRYEKCAQGMKNVLKVYNKSTKVWNAFLRYESRVFLKNSGFSYLYGSISYLFGYEKNRCFSLMLVLFVMHIVEYCSPMGGWCAKSPQFSWVWDLPRSLMVDQWG